MANKQRFLKGIVGLAQGLMLEVPEATIDIYWQYLKDYDSDDLQRVFVELGQTWKWNTFPKPAEFIERLEGSPETKSAQAWFAVSKAATEWGRYRSVCFSDRAVHSAIDALGGWENLCNTPTRELPFLEKRFREAYTAALRYPEQDHPQRLIGTIESENRRAGFVGFIPDIVEIEVFPNRRPVARPARLPQDRRSDQIPYQPLSETEKSNLRQTSAREGHLGGGEK